MSGATISAAVIDDHPLVRRGIKEALVATGLVNIVGEGASAADAVALAMSHHPEVLILDINMPGGGITAIPGILHNSPSSKILMLTVFENMSNVRAALQAGAHGYVLKGVDGDELAKVVLQVCEGKRYVAPELAAKLLGDDDDEEDQSPRSTAQMSLTEDLSAREKQIHLLIGRGLSNLDIGKQLDLKEATVKHYSSRLFKKLGVRNRTEAALLIRR
jgi:two-component system, NarL family, nitrate/nitrite response regulator NarL